MMCRLHYRKQAGQLQAGVYLVFGTLKLGSIILAGGRNLWVPSSIE